MLLACVLVVYAGFGGSWVLPMAAHGHRAYAKRNFSVSTRVSPSKNSNHSLCECKLFCGLRMILLTASHFVAVSHDFRICPHFRSHAFHTLWRSNSARRRSVLAPSSMAWVAYLWTAIRSSVVIESDATFLSVVALILAIFSRSGTAWIKSFAFSWGCTGLRRRGRS